MDWFDIPSPFPLSRRGICRGMPIVCSTSESTSSQSRSVSPQSKSRPNAHTISSSTAMSLVCHRSLTSPQIDRPWFIAVCRLSHFSLPLNFCSFLSAAFRIALIIVVKVTLSGAFAPRVGSLAATPNIASTFRHRAQTFKTAFVCMMEGFTGQLSADMDWYMERARSREVGYSGRLANPRNRIVKVRESGAWARFFICECFVSFK